MGASSASDAGEPPAAPKIGSNEGLIRIYITPRASLTRQLPTNCEHSRMVPLVHKMIGCTVWAARYVEPWSRSRGGVGRPTRFASTRRQVDVRERRSPTGNERRRAAGRQGSGVGCAPCRYQERDVPGGQRWTDRELSYVDTTTCRPFTHAAVWSGVRGPTACRLEAARRPP